VAVEQLAERRLLGRSISPPNLIQQFAVVIGHLSRLFNAAVVVNATRGRFREAAPRPMSDVLLPNPC